MLRFFFASTIIIISFNAFSNNLTISDSVVSFITFKGRFTDSDSLLGLQDVKTGYYEIFQKEIIVKKTDGSNDTIFVRHGSSMWFDENDKLRRVEHYNNGELISMIQCFDSKSRLEATYTIENDAVMNCSLYHKGRIWVMDSFDKSHKCYSRTYYRGKGRVINITRFQNDHVYARIAMKSNGDIRITSHESEVRTHVRFIGSRFR
jgi:hypothetical protein